MINEEARRQLPCLHIKEHASSAIAAIARTTLLYLVAPAELYLLAAVVLASFAQAGVVTVRIATLGDSVRLVHWEKSLILHVVFVKQIQCTIRVLLEDMAFKGIQLEDSFALDASDLTIRAARLVRLGIGNLILRAATILARDRDLSDKSLGKCVWRKVFDVILARGAAVYLSFQLVSKTFLADDVPAHAARVWFWVKAFAHDAVKFWSDSFLPFHSFCF
jgi:hypothetical protein